MTKAPSVRFRVDFGDGISLGVGKVELLEGIARNGSLSEAARQMKMSYRRAWLLLSDLNAGFDQPVVHAVTGGRGGGGATLTSFGLRLIAGYRMLEAEVQPLTEACFRDIARRIRTAAPAPAPGGGKRAVPVASIRGKKPARGG